MKEEEEEERLRTHSDQEQRRATSQHQTATMSLQVCHCGWSKVTSHHGLRTHQGIKGCTPRGVGVPAPPPHITFSQRPVTSQFDWSGWRELGSLGSLGSLPRDAGGPVQKQTATLSLQVCHCGWSKVTSHHGLRTHQGIKGCTPRGVGVPAPPPHITFSQRPVTSQFDWSGWRELGSLGSLPRDAGGPVQKQNVPASPDLSSHVSAAAAEASVMDVIQSLVDDPLFSERPQATPRAAQPLFLPAPQTHSHHITVINQFHQPPRSSADFQTPPPPPAPPHRSTATRPDTVRRALHFPRSAEQVEQLVWSPSTTTAQEAGGWLKERKEEEEERKEEERKEEERKEDAQQLLKAKQDRRRAELQQRIQIRELKMAEVRSSEKSCTLSLDAEWLQINVAFSEAMSVVEAARQEALRPLEERRGDVKGEARDLVHKLQEEVHQLQSAMDELERNPEPQIPRVESADWKIESVDTSLSFGTLRTTTSAMMEQIQLKLEKLSSVELSRLPTFAVDVKLNPTSAHPSLLLTDDGKKVRDGGKTRKVPDTPERFDTFASVLGVNSLTSGRSYWEVEVSGKSGWDLGVARADINRKGKLSLSPDDGYWVIVHYEGERYAALTAPPVSLSLRHKPQKVGVFVDRQEGLVSLYDVTAQSHVFSFTKCSFSGDIFPYFSPHLAKNGENSSPLIISAVKRQ